MNNMEIKQKISELLNEGKPKHEVFKAFSGGAVRDDKLAQIIASHPNQNLCEKHSGKINIVIWMMLTQALFAALRGFETGLVAEPVSTWFAAILFTLLPILFAYGFFKNHAAAFNLYVILAIFQILRIFSDVTQAPVFSAMGIVINLAILGYVLFVRTLLFPDFIFIKPKIINGKYVFSR